MKTPEQYKRIIGWGTGSVWRKHAQEYINKIEYLIDRKAGTFVSDKVVDIKTPDALYSEELENCLIIIFSSFHQEIIVELQGKFNNINAISIDEWEAIKSLNVVNSNVMLEYIAGNALQLDMMSETEREHLKGLYVSIASIVCSVGEDSGTLKFIREQNDIIRKNGGSTLHLVLLGFVENGSGGKLLAMYNDTDGKSINCILNYNMLADIKKFIRRIIIHSVVDNRKLFMQLVEIFEGVHKICYIHDYSSLCENTHLLMEKVNCAATICDGNMQLNNESSGAECRIGGCRFYTEQTRLIRNIYQKIIDEGLCRFIAPSEVAANIFTNVFGVTVEIIPHLKCNMQGVKRLHENIGIEQFSDSQLGAERFKQCTTRKLRVAFVGEASRHKGWDDFLDIYRLFGKQYTFYCLGRCENKIEGVKYVDVSATHIGGLPDMTQALVENEIDIAFLGSKVAETYSYTYFETLQAGVWVVTGTKSGNIQHMVKKHGGGIVVKNFDELKGLFAEEERLKKISERCIKIFNVNMNDKFIKFLINEKRLN